MNINAKIGNAHYKAKYISSTVSNMHPLNQLNRKYSKGTKYYQKIMNPQPIDAFAIV